MAGKVGILVLAVPVVAVAWAVSLFATGPPRDEELAASRAAFEQRTGVRVVRVALVAADGMVDLRYQVLDPDLAADLHDTPPLLIDEGTNEVIKELFMGHAHSGTPKAGPSYPIVFVNTGGLLERGSTVSIVIGEERLEHVVVQ